VPDDEPASIGPEIDRILRDLLPAHVAAEGDRLLREHQRAVSEIRERARHVWEEMLGEEITMLLLWGLEERVADLAARNNLAVRKRELDDELLTELARLQGELTRRIHHLVEESEAERMEDEGEALSS
jgi:hypothetical protein